MISPRPFVVPDSGRSPCRRSGHRRGRLRRRRDLVAAAYVEASEVLTLRGETISRIDVFLRPAAALESVYQAMVAAWPNPGPQNGGEHAGRVR